ncbi:MULTISPECIES: GNAT family N-acetyltransferase [Streptomyces]|uniref:Putative acetyltransferase n=1 Tax=Streptomyces chartreusis NRRL 3882 TaxID=1079985 RepID=A0A2N9B194_STRCX|nr:MULTISPECIES: N-acetyltransferase [Streptomyces]SOR77092.1 putative acetyltransferase [Streptomyces chartreusis NRRL 3882]
MPALPRDRFSWSADSPPPLPPHGSSLRIRTVQGEDLAELERVDTEAFPKNPYSYLVLRQFFDAHRDDLLVLADGSALHGYILVSRPVNGCSWILSLGVARDRRRQGLGRQLMVEALHRLHADGAGEARLAVDPANEAALGLYGSLGFVAEGKVHKDYYGPGEDRLLLRLLL